MQWFRDLRIRGKLLVVSSALLTLTAVLGAFSVARLSRLSGATTELADELLPGTDAAAALRAQVLELRIAQYRTITERTPEARATGVARVREEMAHIEAAATAYEPMIASPVEREHFATFRRKLDAYMADWRGIEAMVMDGAQEAVAERMVSVSAPLHQAMDSSLAALIDFNRTAGAAAAVSSRQIYASARTDIVIGILACVLVGVALSTVLARQMTASLASVMRAATSLQGTCIAGARRALDALAHGDMSVRVSAVTQPIRNSDRDEIGDMARTCDAMIADVQAVLGAVATTQERVDAMVADAIRLVDGARAGELATRIDATAYDGSFRRLVGGLNDTLEAVATPMAEVNGVLSRVADQDLTQRVMGAYHGTFATVASGVNGAIDSLDTTLAQVNSAAQQVAHATVEITSSAQTLAAGASEQAASLEEISASVHVFADMTRRSAAGAVEANGIAASARAHADEGVARMQRLTQAVTEIRESSSETAKIIRTIDEIAFQTNLLALNAAVEAARAGDSGRGFAVVAEEVRSLALRAAAAAHTTTDLIEKGQDAAARGVALNAEVLQSLGNINAEIVRVADVTSVIATSGQQQEEGVAQIMAAVDQINMITQQVAASAEESASAATELSSQSQSLQETVAAFALTESVRSRTGGATPIARAPKRQAPIAYRPTARVTAGVAATPGSITLF